MVTETAGGTSTWERRRHGGAGTTTRVHPAPPLGPISAGPVAVVDGVEISRAAFLELYLRKLQISRSQDRPLTPALDLRHRKRIVERLVRAELVRRDAAGLGVQADTKQVDKLELERRRIVDDWDAALARRGESDATNRALDTTRVLVEAILGTMGAFAVDDVDVLRVYEAQRSAAQRLRYADSQPRRRVAHIVIRSAPAGARGEAAPDEDEKQRFERAAWRRVQDIHARATVSGADFGELARNVSAGDNARQGGRMGILSRSALGETRAKAVFDLELGQISAPLRTDMGYEIIKVYEHFPPGTLPLRAVRDTIVRKARKMKHLGAAMAFHRRLFADAEIRYLLIDPTGGTSSQQRSPVTAAGGSVPSEKLEKLETSGEPETPEAQVRP